MRMSHLPYLFRECVKFAADPSKKWRPLAAKAGPNKCRVCLCGAPEDEHRKRLVEFTYVIFRAWLKGGPRLRECCSQSHAERR